MSKNMHCLQMSIHLRTKAELPMCGCIMYHPMLCQLQVEGHVPVTNSFRLECCFPFLKAWWTHDLHAGNRYHVHLSIVVDVIILSIVWLFLSNTQYRDTHHWNIIRPPCLLTVKQAIRRGTALLTLCRTQWVRCVYLNIIICIHVLATCPLSL